MKGADVKALQQRLSSLKYYPGTIDGQFGGNTEDAVWAFQEINGIKVTGVIDAATKQALVHPRTYQSPSYAGKRATRDRGQPGARGARAVQEQPDLADQPRLQRRRLLLQLRQRRLPQAVTPNGTYNTTVYMPGWVTVPLGEMYNPVFFISTVFAIHGDTYVPQWPGLARLRPGPDGRRGLLPHPGQDPGHAGPRLRQAAVEK